MTKNRDVEIINLISESEIQEKEIIMILNLKCTENELTEYINNVLGYAVCEVCCEWKEMGELTMDQCDRCRDD